MAASPQLPKADSIAPTQMENEGAAGTQPADSCLQGFLHQNIAIRLVNGQSLAACVPPI